MALTEVCVCKAIISSRRRPPWRGRWPPGQSSGSLWPVCGVCVCGVWSVCAVCVRVVELSIMYVCICLCLSVCVCFVIFVLVWSLVCLCIFVVRDKERDRHKARREARAS